MSGKRVHTEIQGIGYKVQGGGERLMRRIQETGDRRVKTKGKGLYWSLTEPKEIAEK